MNVLPEPGADEAAIVAAFLRGILDDRAEGRRLPLEDYQRRWPGREALIATAFRDLEADADTAAEAPPRGTPAEGHVGPYRLLRFLGGGGQGDVHLAEDTRSGRRVAIKFLRALAAVSDEARARFRREAELVARLDHPGICALEERGADGVVPYLVMRFVEGETLAALLARSRREAKATATVAERGAAPTARTTALPAAQAIALLEEVARAVHAAHEAGVLHRDLKPANIMVTPEGRPVVLDFGVARPFEDEDASYRSRSGDVFGTPAYLAPELLELPPARAGRETEVYALGVTLFEALTGRRPFEAPTREAVFRAILTGRPPDLRSIAPGLPSALATVVATAMERDPRRRYRSAEAFADDLARIRDGRPIAATRPSILARAWAFTRREPLKVVSALLLLLVVALGGFLVARWPELAAQAESARRQRLEGELLRAFRRLAEGEPGAGEAFAAILREDPASVEAGAGLVMALLRADRAEEALGRLDRPPFDGAGATAAVRGVLRAEALRELGRSEEAASAEPSDPGAGGALRAFVAGRRWLARGERGDGPAYANAERELRRAVLGAPAPRALFDFAWADAAARGRDAGIAAEVGEAILARWPDSDLAPALAASALAVADPPRALRLLRTVVERHPDEPAFLDRLGGAALAAGELDLAERSFRDVLRRRPDDFDAAYGLAEVLDRRGRSEQAATVYEELLVREGGHPGVSYALGCVHLAAGRLEAARRAFEATLAALPGHAEAHDNLGITLHQLGEYDRALEEASTAVRLRPSCGRFHLNLASVQLTRGDAALSLETLRGIGDDESVAFAGRRVAGRAWLALGEPARASEILRRAVALRPADAAVRADHGNALFECGDFDGAADAYAAAAERLPTGDPSRAPLAERVEECRRLSSTAAAFAAGTPGDGTPPGASLPAPASRAERIRFATAAAARGWFVAAAEGFRELFELEPAAASDRLEQLRLRAAITAARAAAGGGRDGSRIAAEERARWRAQTLVWLEAEAEVVGRPRGDDDERSARSRRALHRLLAEPAFESLRDPARLAWLDDEEAARWRGLWDRLAERLSEMDS